MSKNTLPITVNAIDHNPIILDEIAVLIGKSTRHATAGTAVNADELVSLHRKSTPGVAFIDLELADLAESSRLNPRASPRWTWFIQTSHKNGLLRNERMSE